MQEKKIAVLLNVISIEQSDRSIAQYTNAGSTVSHKNAIKASLFDYIVYRSILITAVPAALIELTNIYARYFLSDVSTQTPASALRPIA